MSCTTDRPVHDGPRSPRSFLRLGSRSRANMRQRAYTTDTTASSGEDSCGESLEDTEQSWISWFCGLRGNELFCEVDEDYIQDDFNLSGLSSSVPYYDYALDTILDIDRSHSDSTDQQQELI